MDPATAALTLAPVIFGAFRRQKKGPNRYGIINRYRQARPVGYTSAEDEAAAERARTRITGASEAAAQRRRAENVRQTTARGLSGPAAAALERQASDISAAGAEEGARTSADLLYKSFQSNLGYERAKTDRAFGAELGVATQDAMLADAQNASFWNSLNETIPAVAGAFSGLGRDAAGIVGRATTADPTMLSTASDATLRSTPTYRPRVRVAY